MQRMWPVRNPHQLFSSKPRSRCELRQISKMRSRIFTAMENKQISGRYRSNSCYLSVCRDGWLIHPKTGLCGFPSALGYQRYRSQLEWSRQQMCCRWTSVWWLWRFYSVLGSCRKLSTWYFGSLAMALSLKVEGLLRTYSKCSTQRSRIFSLFVINVFPSSYTASRIHVPSDPTSVSESVLRGGSL